MGSAATSNRCYRQYPSDIYAEPVWKILYRPLEQRFSFGEVLQSFAAWLFAWVLRSSRHHCTKLAI